VTDNQALETFGPFADAMAQAWRKALNDIWTDFHHPEHNARPRNFFSVKVFRMDLEADFKRLFGVVFWC